MRRLAADIGGTFSDVVATDAEGGVRLAKAFTTPEDPSGGLLAAAAKLGVDWGGVGVFLHGTTVVINALLQGDLPRAALLTTRGFRDVLEIRRGNSPETYSLCPAIPPPLVPRALRLEVDERLDADGRVVRPLDEAAARAVLRALAGQGIGVIAVCLLHAYANPVHEQALRRLIEAEIPGALVSLSHEVAPEWREYERTSTTVINALTTPVMARYVERLEARLRAAGFRGRPLLMQSNGGVTAAEAARHPIRTLMSGPVGGVVAAAGIAAAKGLPDAISLDMGGTSADVGLIHRGRWLVRHESEFGGRPILGTTLDVKSVGAGGGSIAHLDRQGGFRVGPRSAGAVPGPACYGRGGDLPTVTDAHLLVGHLDPAYFLGGEVPLDSEAAWTAYAGLARALVLAPEAATLGALDIVAEVMARAIREITIERGHDPRGFALIAFGGCGGLHASNLARRLGIRRAVVPARPGVLSALGILGSALRHDYTEIVAARLEGLAPAEIAEVVRRLEKRGLAQVADEGARGPTTAVAEADCRYVGQLYTLTVPLPSPLRDVAEIGARFREAHRLRYGHEMEGAEVEVVALRVTVVAAAEREGEAAPVRPGRGAAEPKGSREILLAEGRGRAPGRLRCPVYDRKGLGVGAIVEGPAIIEEPTATTLLLPGDRAEVDAFGHLDIAIGGRDG